MKKTIAITTFFLLLNTSLASADIVEIDLFELSCQQVYDFNSPYWTADFDLGIKFLEISNVYIDWAGEITAGLAVNPWVPGPQPFPFDEGIGASLGGEPYARRATISGGEATYPEPEVFDCLSEFQLLGTTTWTDLLDGRGTIIIGYEGLASSVGGVIEHGFVVLNEASMVIEGTIVPEPATFLFLVLGVALISVNKSKK
jgi:hypothetical protein